MALTRLTKIDGGSIESPLTFSGIITATSITGTAASFSGIVTANSFRGDGSQLTGVAGLGTALDNTVGSLGSLIFKTPSSFRVGAGTSVLVESDATSGNIAYTRLDSIVVSSGSTVRIGSGTTLVMNVLGVF